ncbi:helix-turn-helix domain-containing protein [Effusibacillus dendaii]|nr:helix-turn-helix domain-containing protein [Effusibacillus dendaii]
MDEKKISERIRLLRTHLKLTQQDLADKCGYTKGMISKIENGRISLPIATLSKIANALNVKLSWFFEEEGEDSELIITKKEERTPIVSNVTEFGYFYYGLANRKSLAKIETFMVIVPEVTEGKQPFSHQEEEFAFVVEGAIDLYYDGKLYPLEEGDSAYYFGDKPHMFLSRNNQESKVLVIIVSN